MKFNFKKIIAIFCVGTIALNTCFFALASGGNNDDTQGKSVSVNVKGTVGDTLSLAKMSPPTLILPCKNAVLMSADTGEVLYEQLPDEQVPIASITKIMTLLLTLEAVEKGKISLSDKVPVSEFAYGMGGSQIWLEPGELFTLDELIKAICISSANDAAVAVCEYVGGSEGVFLQMMNDRATELGMKNTHFCNACGLDEEGHYSSARDVAIMSRELLRHPKILEYSGIWMDSLRGGLTQLTNTNKLLKRYSGITGLKTGTTNKAGVCISATATREGMGLIAVVLGSVNSEDRFLSATTLLDYGFASYEIVPFPTVENLPKTIPIKHGVEKETTISANLPKKLFVNKGEGKNITAEFCLPDSLTAPIKKGDGIAKIALKQEKNTIGEYAITAEKEVNEMSFNAAFKLLTKELFTL